MDYTVLYCDNGKKEKKTVVVEKVLDMEDALDLFLEVYDEYNGSLPHVLGVYPIEDIISEGIGVGVNIGELLETLSEDDLLDDEDDDYYDDDDEEFFLGLNSDNAEAMPEAFSLIGSMAGTPLFEHLESAIPDIVPMLVKMHIDGDSIFDHEDLIEEVFGQDVVAGLMIEVAKTQVKEGGTGSLLEVLSILAQIL